MLKKKNGGEVMAMPTYEELLAIIKIQQATIEELTEKLAKAEARIAELEEQVHKDSHNSSKPPSSDGYKKPAPKSLRKKSGKKAGGQKGHKGHHMALDNPDRVERIYPKHCANCPHRENCAHLKVHDSCYVVDVIVKKETVKYQMLECNCNGVQETAERPAGIKGTVTYGADLKSLICILNTQGMVAMQNLCNIIKDLTGIKPSVGTVANMLHSAAGVAKPVVYTFPQLLHQEPVVNCDETGADVNGKLHYVHVMCTKDLTYYALSKKRGKEAMDEIGFLPKYKGIVEHDFWQSYFAATEAEHAMCCAHILRELTGIFENHPEQIWAREMYDQLLVMHQDADFYNQHPEIKSRQNRMECLKRQYDEILEKGVRQNPIPEREKGKRGKPKKGKIRALIDRLIKHKGDVCRFADNSLVPFTNNQAGRDLRMVKIKNKVIGTFRSEQGAKDFLILKSFTSTAAKNGVTAFEALRSLLYGQFALVTE